MRKWHATCSRPPPVLERMVRQRFFVPEMEATPCLGPQVAAYHYRLSSDPAGCNRPPGSLHGFLRNPAESPMNQGARNPQTSIGGSTLVERLRSVPFRIDSLQGLDRGAIRHVCSFRTMEGSRGELGDEPGVADGPPPRTGSTFEEVVTKSSWLAILEAAEDPDTIAPLARHGIGLAHRGRPRSSGYPGHCRIPGSEGRGGDFPQDRDGSRLRSFQPDLNVDGGPQGVMELTLRAGGRIEGRICVLPASEATAERCTATMTRLRTLLHDGGDGLAAARRIGARVYGTCRLP